MSWKIDPAHSHIQFSTRHMMISTVRGSFESLTGTIQFDEENPQDSSVAVAIDAASINTGVEDRDNHLRSDDFLDVGEYPTLTFRSQRVQQIDENSGRLIGDLTIKGVSNEVILDVHYHGMVKSPWGQWSAGFSASTTINRKDWGLNWNQALETGGVLVGDRVTIDVEVELIREAEESGERNAVAI